MLVQFAFILCLTQSTACLRTPPSSCSTSQHHRLLQVRLRRALIWRLRCSRLRGAEQCLCFARRCICCANVGRRWCWWTRISSAEGVSLTALVMTVKVVSWSRQTVMRKTNRGLGKDRGLGAYYSEIEGGLFCDYVCAPCCKDRKEIELVLC